MELKEIEAFINKIPDHPKPGILFYDISTLILDNEAFSDSLRLMCESVSELEIDLVAGIDARGFIFGSAVILDPFRDYRWDYFNSVQIGEKLVQENKLTIYFDTNGFVERWIIEKLEP